MASKLPRGKARFYKLCRFDEEIKEVIKYYNNHLRHWKSEKQLYLCKDEDEKESDS